MRTPRMFDLLVDIAFRGDVRPVVAATYGLDRVAEARQQLSRRTHVGKLVVLPG